MTNYYVHDNSQTSGPFEESRVKQMLSEGSVTVNAKICEVGKESWIDISSLVPTPTQVAPAPTVIAQVTLGGSNTKSLHCAQCNTVTTHVTDEPNHLLHLIISIITGGAWVIVWVLLILFSDDPKCSVCGRDGPSSIAKKTAGFGCFLIIAVIVIILAAAAAV